MSTTPPWVVLKFGGTSVASAAHWQTIARAAADHVAAGRRPLLVCSALSGVSDQLVALAHAALANAAGPVLEDLQARHARLARAAGVALPPGVTEELAFLERLAQGVHLVQECSPRVRARMLAAGERMSTLLGEVILRTHGVEAGWLDARELLTTVDEPEAPEERQWLNARCAPGEDAALAQRLARRPEAVLLTQGFVARRPDGGTAVLGRGGSDTSATLLAARLSAEWCEIWTDVPGMFTANPRAVPGARLLRRLDFAEAQEIATTGAKVLHPACIHPARLAGRPIHIRCTPRPDLEGTTIGPAAQQVAGVKAVSSRTGVVLVSMETVGMWQQVGFLAKAARCIADQGLSIDLVATSETNVTVSLDASANLLDDAALDRLHARLSAFCEPRVLRDCASVSLVGSGIRSILHRLGGVFELFEEQRVHLVSQAASDLNLTVVVDASQAARLVGQLHAVLLQEIEGTAPVGPRWDELVADPDEAPAAGPTPWWGARRAALLAVAEAGTPAYAYDAETLRRQAGALRGLASVDQVLFAIKANPHPPLLRLLAEAGLGFECVSPGEVARARETLAAAGAIAPVLFTPNFAPRSDYAAGLEAGARVTLDNLHPLERWGELFSGRDIFLRVDPGKGHGHHAHVRTAGERSKFGVPPEELARAAALAREHGARVVGLHAHVGSGVRDPSAWPATAERLVAAAEAHFPDVRILDLGGGLGVPEKPGQAPLDLAALDAALARFKAAHPGYALWLEPGRFVVAEAGVLLARVTQLKDKGSSAYVGVDAGMHTLIRPALYGAYHGIENLSRLDQAGPWVQADVVGPICETGDVLGRDRRLVQPEEGDVLIIATAGAYGAAMSSTYNLRGRPREVLLDADR